MFTLYPESIQMSPVLKTMAFVIKRSVFQPCLELIYPIGTAKWNLLMAENEQKK